MSDPNPHLPVWHEPNDGDAETAEVRLHGGDVTQGLVRVGHTVRRPRGPHSALVHRVLQYLESVGFTGAPRFLGVDARDREVLTYIEGEVAGRPWPEWVADADRAVSVARLLRSLDDHMIEWGLPADGVAEELSPQGLPAALGPTPSFLGHRDITPENVVFADGRAKAFIDFDMVRPSSRVDEVCNLLLWWAPLMPLADREPVLRDQDACARAALLVDAYGLGPTDRSCLVEVAINTTERSWFLMRERARQFGGGWQRMWDDGVGDRIVRRRVWLIENRSALHRAIARN